MLGLRPPWIQPRSLVAPPVRNWTSSFRTPTSDNFEFDLFRRHTQALGDHLDRNPSEKRVRSWGYWTAVCSRARQFQKKSLQHQSGSAPYRTVCHTQAFLFFSAINLTQLWSWELQWVPLLQLLHTRRWFIVHSRLEFWAVLELSVLSRQEKETPSNWTIYKHWKRFVVDLNSITIPKQVHFVCFWRCITLGGKNNVSCFTFLLYVVSKENIFGWRTLEIESRSDHLTLYRSISIYHGTDSDCFAR